MKSMFDQADTLLSDCSRKGPGSINNEVHASHFSGRH